MAELASAYPTAGGLYFWAHPARRRTDGGWSTAWFNMIGQITITSGINYRGVVFIVGAITGSSDAAAHGHSLTIVTMVVVISPDAHQHLRHPLTAG